MRALNRADVKAVVTSSKGNRRGLENNFPFTLATIL
jgi:hypothetical protein